MTISIRWALAAAVPTVLGLGGLACAARGDDDGLASGVGDDAGAPSTIEAGTPTAADASDASDASTVELCSAAGWCPVERPRPEANYVAAAGAKSALYAVFGGGSAGERVAAWTTHDGWTASSLPLTRPISSAAFTTAAVVDDDAVLIAAVDLAGFYGLAYSTPGSNGIFGYYAVPPSDPTQTWTVTEFSLACATPPLVLPAAPKLANIGGQVYLAACTGLYRFDRSAFLDGSAEYWKPVYVDDGAGTPALSFSVAGTAGDDLWLASSRSSCLTLVHIGPDGAKTIADSNPTKTGCVANGKGMVDPVSLLGKVGVAPAKGVYALAQANRLMRWTLAPGGNDVTVEYSTATNVWSESIAGLWQGKDRLWATMGDPSSSQGMFIVQVEDPWNSEDAFQLSTQERNGFVDGKPLKVITGTSDAVWVLGDDGVALRRQEK